jgi:ParB family transcriptional regulator, chromosome partitioning protein
MAKSRLFGGMNLGDIAQSVKDRAQPSPFESGSRAQPVVPAAELALTGRVTPPLERENVFLVDPKKVRAWKHHNRTSAWYTRERCQDLIDSIAKDGQQEPAVARRLSGDPNFEYELVSGMRRRFACEHLNKPLRLRVVSVDDARAAVLMHIENEDRQDITPMERAMSFLEHLDAGLFATQEALAEAMGQSKGQVTKMLKAASVLRQATLARLFPDPSAVPVDPAYKLATLMDRPGARDVVMDRAQYLAKKGPGGGPSAILKALLASLDNSRKVEPLRQSYPMGKGKVVVTRNARGKVVLAFPDGLAAADREAVLEVVGTIIKDVGRKG